MKGWPQNDDPESFWATPVDVAAAKLAETLMEERPQVIMTTTNTASTDTPITSKLTESPSRRSR